MQDLICKCLRLTKPAKCKNTLSLSSKQLPNSRHVSLCRLAACEKAESLTGKLSSFKDDKLRKVKTKPKFAHGTRCSKFADLRGGPESLSVFNPCKVLKPDYFTGPNSIDNESSVRRVRPAMNSKASLCAPPTVDSSRCDSHFMHATGGTASTSKSDILSRVTLVSLLIQRTFE